MSALASVTMMRRPSSLDAIKPDELASARTALPRGMSVDARTLTTPRLRRARSSGDQTLEAARGEEGTTEEVAEEEEEEEEEEPPPPAPLPPPPPGPPAPPPPSASAAAPGPTEGLGASITALPPEEPGIASAAAGLLVEEEEEEDEDEDEEEEAFC